MKLTQDKLKELLDYNPDTGYFTCKTIRGKLKAGDISGGLNNRGYWHIEINRKKYLAHRLAFLWMEGYFPENDIDHIDRNRSNNKWENLREVSHSCNMRNQKININNKSSVSGVYWHKRDKKWMSQIKIPKQKIYLGSFDNILDAVKARWDAEIKYKFHTCNTDSSAYKYLKENNLI